MNLEKVKSELVDSKLGLIKGIKEGLDIQVPIPMHIFTTYRKALLDTSMNEIIRGNLEGLGYDCYSKKSAEIRAIGECIERYCASFSPVERFIEGSFNDLIKNNRALDPTTITRPFPSQYKEIFGKSYEITKNSKMYWIESLDEIKQVSTYIPVTTAFLNLPAKYKKNTIREPISTGLAAGSTIQMAKEGAVLECIERDSIVITWLNRYSPPIINLDTIADKEIQEQIKMCTKKGFSVYFLDITTDIGVPTYFVVIKNKYKKTPFIQFGSKAHYCKIKALKGALLEAMVGINLFARALKLDYVDITDIKNITNIKDHINYYATGNGEDKLDFLLCGELIPFEDSTEEVRDYEQLLLKFKTLEINLFFVDLTTEDVIESNICVYRAVIPELAFLETQLPMLDCKRLKSVPIRMGYYRSNPLNKDPHPFP